MLYLVEFTGPFGYLKPWTAVRDGRTNSLAFLTPSTVEGIRLKLGVSAIVRYRLHYAQLDVQQETTHARGWVPQGAGTARKGIRPRSVLLRGVLIEPRLVLAFVTEEDAHIAAHQHLCLSRNEDVLFPDGKVRPLSVADFEQLPGAELLPAGEDEPGSVLVGHNRYLDNAPMYGRLLFTQQPAVLGTENPFSNVH